MQNERPMGLTLMTQRAEERYAALSDQAEEARALVRSITDRIRENTHAIRQMDANRVEDIKTLERELERHNHRLKLAQETMRSTSRVHAAVRSWLTGLPKNVVLEDYDDELGQIRPDEDHMEACVRVRLDIEELARARLAIARALLPTDELVEQAYRHVDALAAKGKPPLRLDRDRLVVGIPPDHVSMMAWLFPDAMKDRFREEIEARRRAELRPNSVVLSAKERDEKLASLDKAIVALERQEEAIIREAGELGTTISRREQCSPLALLSVTVFRLPSERRTAA